LRLTRAPHAIDKGSSNERSIPRWAEKANRLLCRDKYLGRSEAFLETGDRTLYLAEVVGVGTGADLTPFGSSECCSCSNRTPTWGRQRHRARHRRDQLWWVANKNPVCGDAQSPAGATATIRISTALLIGCDPSPWNLSRHSTNTATRSNSCISPLGEPLRRC